MSAPIKFTRIRGILAYVRMISTSFNPCILWFWRSMFELFNAALIFEILLRVAAIFTATCNCNLQYKWACRPASTSRFFLKSCHWTKFNRKFPSTPFLALILCAYPRVTSAVPTKPVPKADDGTATEFLLVLLFCLLCALGVLVAGHFIAKRTGEMASYGTFMGIESMAWWLIATDPNESILFLFTMLGLWAVSSYAFCHAAFDQVKIPKSSILYSIIIAGFLDVSLVRMTTGADAPPSQRDLLIPALLSMSVALGVTVVSYPLIRNMLRDPPATT